MIAVQKKEEGSVPAMLTARRVPIAAGANTARPAGSVVFAKNLNLRKRKRDKRVSVKKTHAIP